MIIRQRPKDLLGEFLRAYNEVHEIDMKKANRLIREGISYYSKEEFGAYQRYLEDRWYSSIDRHEVDYSVYDDEYYFTDLWVCWVLYSRGYLRAIVNEKSLVYDKVKDAKVIVDLGCGIGYTTASLRQMFKGSIVYGTNIKGTKQYDFCERMSREYDFNIVSDVSQIDHDVDLIFASEYFEHIQWAIDHLLDIIVKLKPKYLYVANSFNTHSVGHFEWYKYKNGSITSFYEQKEMSRRFNKVLTLSHYIKVKTNLWNNRPTLWMKSDRKEGFLD